MSDYPMPEGFEPVGGIETGRGDEVKFGSEEHENEDQNPLKSELGSWPVFPGIG